MTTFQHKPVKGVDSWGHPCVYVGNEDFDPSDFPPIGREVVTQEGCRRTVASYGDVDGWVDEYGDNWPDDAVWAVIGR